MSAETFPRTPLETPKLNTAECIWMLAERLARLGESGGRAVKDKYWGGISSARLVFSDPVGR